LVACLGISAFACSGVNGFIPITSTLLLSMVAAAIARWV
jgi:hypothetical protein